MRTIKWQNERRFGQLASDALKRIASARDEVHPGHHREVVQRAQQAATARPAESDLGHLLPFSLDGSPGTPTAPNIWQTASGKLERSRFASRTGIMIGRCDRSLMNIRTWRLPIRMMFPYQSPSFVVDFI
jgi:hypothetical protein